MSWLKIGYGAVPFLVSIILSMGLMVLGFRKFVAPDIVASLAEATKTAQTLASLGGIKKQNWHDEQALEEVITKELIYQKMPDIQLLKLALSPGSWEQVEEMIEENPAAALKMYEKYKHLLGGTEQKTVQYMF